MVTGAPVFGADAASRITQHRSVAVQAGQTARQNQTLLAAHDLVPSQCPSTSTRLPMLGKQVGLKIAYPASRWQRLCGAPWREQQAEEVPDGGSNRCPAPLRTCTTSTSTSLPPLADDAVSPIPVEAVTFGSAAMVLAYVHYRG
jgi:hypothetical protein